MRPRLLQLYKADQPDVVTVILESDGFADLLERTEFMQRVSQQDARIIDRVRRAKAESVAAERRLDEFERRQSEVTAVVARRAEEVVAIKDRLVDRQREYKGVRGDKNQALVSTRADRRELEGHFASFEKEQAKVQARLAAVGSGNLSAGRVRQGSGSMIWPINSVVQLDAHGGGQGAVEQVHSIAEAHGQRTIEKGWRSSTSNRSPSCRSRSSR